MPSDPNTQNGYCKGHAGLMEAVDHIKCTQRARDDTVTRIWKAIEARVSTKMFIAIITIAVSVFGLIIGAVFLNQHHILSSLIRSQEMISSKMGDMKIDIEIIKQQLRQASDRDDRRRHTGD